MLYIAINIFTLPLVGATKHHLFHIPSPLTDKSAKNLGPIYAQTESHDHENQAKVVPWEIEVQFLQWKGCQG